MRKKIEEFPTRVAEGATVQNNKMDNNVDNDNDNDGMIVTARASTQFFCIAIK